MIDVRNIREKNVIDVRNIREKTLGTKRETKVRLEFLLRVLLECKGITKRGSLLYLIDFGFRMEMLFLWM